MSLLRSHVIAGLTLGGVALVAAPLSSACGEAAPDPLHTITFIAQSDPGEPLAGVQIGTTFNGRPQPFGATDASGVWVQRLRAPYGTTIPINAVCPAGHRPAATVPSIRFDPIRSLDPAAAARGIEHSIQCLPLERDAVVIIRATGSALVAGVPVLVDGREVGRIDEGGVAHVPLRYVPNTAFRVELAAGSINPYLQPNQPAHDFTIPDEDVILSFDQPFTFEPPAAPVRRRRTVRRPTIPTRAAPVRIGGRR
jgi:hypothetical protein